MLPDCRALAAKLVRSEDVLGIELRRQDGAILVETNSPDQFYARLASLKRLRPTHRSTKSTLDDDNLRSCIPLSGELMSTNVRYPRSADRQPRPRELIRCLSSCSRWRSPA